MAKKKDKKRKQRKERKSKLPSSVEALLGYLGGGGPAPVYNQPIQAKERAGIDSIETLSQVIRQQSLMNASYMQNMERLAFRNEIETQLKKQSEKSQEEIEKAKKETESKIKEAKSEGVELLKRTYQRRSDEEKERELEKKLGRYELKGKSEKAKEVEKSLKLLKSKREIESQYSGNLFGLESPVIEKVESETVGKKSGQVDIRAYMTPQKVEVEKAESIGVVQLKANDPMGSILAGVEVPSQVSGGVSQEIAQGLAGFVSVDANFSSGIVGGAVGGSAGSSAGGVSKRKVGRPKRGNQ
jgi:hypothetical protein